jgi:hypothetical protein
MVNIIAATPPFAVNHARHAQRHPLYSTPPARPPCRSPLTLFYSPAAINATPRCRLKPMKAMVKNFLPSKRQQEILERKRGSRTGGKTAKEAQRELQVRLVDPENGTLSRLFRTHAESCFSSDACLQEKISITAALYQSPFMPHGEKCGTYSLSVPGRHRRPPNMDLVKPWEYTARSSRLANWEKPKGRYLREADDPFGLELRAVSDRTGFPLPQLYTVYQKMGFMADSFQGVRDRDITGAERTNFIEEEFVAFLKRSGDFHPTFGILHAVLTPLQPRSRGEKRRGL